MSKQVEPELKTRLLPCPLFGHEPSKDEWPTGPYIAVSGAPNMPVFYAIVCPNCCSTAYDENKERVIKKWNTRVPVDRVAPRVDAAHCCTNGIYRPYPAVLCSSCKYVTHNLSIEELCERLNAAAPKEAEEAPIRREVKSSRHPHFTAADHERMKETLDSLSDYPTEEEAEAVLQACGTSGKEVVNEFIERLLKENSELKTRLAAKPSGAAREAAEEIREWFGITGLVDGEGLNEVAAIISRHFPAAAESSKQDELADEVQHRMDQVVEAAVEWHQAGREGGEWFEAAEKLGAAIDSLLELRGQPPAPLVSDRDPDA